MIGAEELPGILLVKNNNLIWHIKLAQSTAFMNWSNIEWIAFSDNQQAERKLLLPTTNKLQTINAVFEMSAGNL